MDIVLFLIVFPVFLALMLPAVRNDRVRARMICVSAGLIAAGTVFAAVSFLPGGGAYDAFGEAGGGAYDAFGEAGGGAGLLGPSGPLGTLGPMAIRYGMLAAEAAIAVYIVIAGVRRKKYLAPLLAIVQCGLMVWFELRYGRGIEVQYNMYADQLSVILILIAGILGSLICIAAAGADGDRRMLRGLFLSLTAVFGLVTSANLEWMYFFWQVSALAVFWLSRAEETGSGEDPDGISQTDPDRDLQTDPDGISRTDPDRDLKLEYGRAFRALSLQLLGGLFFVIAMATLGILFGTLEFSTLLVFGSIYGEAAAIPAAFLAIGCFAKAGLMPFGSWLKDNAALPAPAFALVQSFGAAACGVYPMIRVAPLLGMTNFAGIMVMVAGGITFLFASLAAISCDDLRNEASCSTAAAMGLATACCGIGSAGAVWAAIMILVFHAIAKALLVFCLDAAGRFAGGTRSCDLAGLMSRMPRLTICLITAMAGNFLAPLGSLLAQWAAFSAVAGSGNFLLTGMICFGMAAAAYSQTRWIGQLAAGPAKDMDESAGRNSAAVNADEAGGASSGKFVRIVLAILLLLSSLMPLLISVYVAVPYLKTSFEGVTVGPMSAANMTIMAAMLAVLILLGAACFLRTGDRTADTEIAGVNVNAEGESEAAEEESKAAEDESKAAEEESKAAEDGEPADFLSEDPAAFLQELFAEGRMVLAGGVLSGAMMVIGIGDVVASMITLLGGAA